MSKFFKVIIFLFFAVCLNFSFVNAQEFNSPPSQGMPSQDQDMKSPEQGGMQPARQEYFSKENVDYAQIYEELEPVDYKYQHNIDPYQQQDYKDYMWSPYPLVRITEPLYFKKTIIPIGYYLLTPRKVDGRDVVTFKTNGKVVFIIPAYETVQLPVDYYANEEIAKPKPKRSLWKKFVNCLAVVFKKHTDRRAMQMDPPKSKIETNAVDSDFFEMDFYYETNIYKMIFRTYAN